MNISHYPVDSNKAKLVAIQGTNQSKYLQPYYFLPASCSESYYSKKYIGNHTTSGSVGIRPIYQSKRGKISRVASVMLLSLSFLATALEVNAQPNTELSTLGQSTIEPNQSFVFGNSFAGISTNAPIPPKMPQSPLAAPFNSETTPPAPPPVPPAAPAMPDLVSDASIGGKSDNRSTLCQIIRNIGQQALKKVKREPKPKVVSSDGDLMSQLHNTLERRRNGVAGEENSDAKPKKVVKQVPKLTPEEQERKKEENLARAATIREQNKKKWEEEARKNEEIARERRRVEAEAVKARIEQKRRERGENTENVVNGIDRALHHNIVSALRSEIASLREQLKGLSSNLGMNTGGRTEEPIYSEPLDSISIASSSSTQYEEPWQDPDALIGEALATEFGTSDTQRQYEPSAAPLSAFSSLEDLNITASNTLGEEEEKALKILDEVESAKATDILEASDIPLSFTNQEMTKEVSVVADIKDITEELQDENTTASVLEILDEAEEEDSLLQSMSANLSSTRSTEPQEQSTVRNQEELLEKASTIASSSTQARQASKIAIHHIKHRIFMRDMLVALAAGDANESDQSQILGYSVWSSGAFGSAKQKASNNSNGYSSKILGGSIGADVKFENELLLGASFSKIRSDIKHVNQSANKKLNTYIASLYGSSSLKENLTLGVIGSVGFSPKPRSKLLSLESHLNYQIELPQDIKLLPNIGFKYEYERSKIYQEQIGGNISIAHARKSYQALSTEIGSRVIFAPIKLTDIRRNEGAASNHILSTLSVTPTAHFLVERRIGSRGASNPLNVTYQELGQTIWAGSLPANAKTAKTSLNTGIGLIASHKNIKLELLYDHTRQKRLKAHQGMLKLKVNL